MYLKNRLLQSLLLVAASVAFLFLMLSIPLMALATVLVMGMAALGLVPRRLITKGIRNFTGLFVRQGQTLK